MFVGPKFRLGRESQVDLTESAFTGMIVRFDCGESSRNGLVITVFFRLLNCYNSVRMDLVEGKICRKPRILPWNMEVLWSSPEKNPLNQISDKDSKAAKAPLHRGNTWKYAINLSQLRRRLPEFIPLLNPGFLGCSWELVATKHGHPGHSTNSRRVARDVGNMMDGRVWKNLSS